MTHDRQLAEILDRLDEVEAGLDPVPRQRGQLIADLVTLRRLIDDRRALSDYSRYHVTRTLADIPAALRSCASAHRTRATVQWIF